MIDEGLKRAASDHKRITPDGRKLGADFAKLADKCAAKLADDGEPDERCKSCAFRAGTVPNGCPQTMLDVTKAVFEKVPFLCHANFRGGVQQVCHGWFAIQTQTKHIPSKKCDWEFSPPDEP